MTDPGGQFEEFVSLCEQVLAAQGENRDLVKLIRKRYDQCNETFRSSPAMLTLIDTTTLKIQTERKKLFVHLKDFMAELKAWSGGGKVTEKMKKRKAEDSHSVSAKKARTEENPSDASDIENRKIQLAVRRKSAGSPRATTAEKTVGKTASMGLRRLSSSSSKGKSPFSSPQKPIPVPSPQKPSFFYDIASIVSAAFSETNAVVNSAASSAHTELAAPSPKVLILSHSSVKSVNSEKSTADNKSLVLEKASSTTSIQRKNSDLTESGSKEVVDTARRTREEETSDVKTTIVDRDIIIESSNDADDVMISEVCPPPKPQIDSSKLKVDPKQLVLPSKGFLAGLSSLSPSEKDKLSVGDRNGKSVLSVADRLKEQLGSESPKPRSRGLATSPKPRGSESPKLSRGSGSPKPRSRDSDVPKPSTSSSRSQSPDIIFFDESESNSSSTNVSRPSSVVPIYDNFASLVDSDDDFQPAKVFRSPLKVDSRPPSKINRAADKGRSSTTTTTGTRVVSATTTSTGKPTTVTTTSKGKPNSRDSGFNRAGPSTSKDYMAGPSTSSYASDGDGDEAAKDVKLHKHIRRLETLLEKLRNKIESVREMDLSLDDLGEDNSAYIFEDKLQKKFVKVWNKLCELQGRTNSSGRPIERRFRYQGTRYPEINRKIERFVNRPDKETFPDFHDVKGIIKKVNTRWKLGLNVKQMNNISRETFLDVGEALQKRRHEDFISTFHNRQTMMASYEPDPALFDAELNRKLEENQRIGKSRLEQVISKYTHLQTMIGSDDDDYDHENPNRLLPEVREYGAPTTWVPAHTSEVAAPSKVTPRKSEFAAHASGVRGPASRIMENFEEEDEDNFGEEDKEEEFHVELNDEEEAGGSQDYDGMIERDLDIPPPQPPPSLRRVDLSGSPIVFFDLETTGLGHFCHITQIGAVGPAGRLSRYVIPKKEIGVIAQEITGITCIGSQVYLNNVPVPALPLKEALGEFFQFLGEKPIALCGHNIKAFDCPVLVNAAQACGLLEALKRRVSGCVDSLRLFRETQPGLPSYRLGSIYEHNFGESFSAHDALAEADAVRKVAEHLAISSELMEKHSFDLEYVEKVLLWNAQKEHNFPTWLPLVQERAISMGMAIKAAGSGLSLKHLEAAYRRGGVKAVHAILAEKTSQRKPRVTKMKSILESVSNFIAEKRDGASIVESVSNVISKSCDRYLQHPSSYVDVAEGGYGVQDHDQWDDDDENGDHNTISDDSKNGEKSQKASRSILHQAALYGDDDDNDDHHDDDENGHSDTIDNSKKGKKGWKASGSMSHQPGLYGDDDEDEDDDENGHCDTVSDDSQNSKKESKRHDTNSESDDSQNGKNPQKASSSMLHQTAFCGDDDDDDDNILCEDATNDSNNSSKVGQRARSMLHLGGAESEENSQDSTLLSVSKKRHRQIDSDEDFQEEFCEDGEFVAKKRRGHIDSDEDFDNAGGFFKDGELPSFANEHLQFESSKKKNIEDGKLKLDSGENGDLSDSGSSSRLVEGHLSDSRDSSGGTSGSYGSALPRPERNVQFNLSIVQEGTPEDEVSDGNNEEFAVTRNFEVSETISVAAAEKRSSSAETISSAALAETAAATAATVAASSIEEDCDDGEGKNDCHEKRENAQVEKQKIGDSTESVSSKPESTRSIYIKAQSSSNSSTFSHVHSQGKDRYHSTVNGHRVRENGNEIRIMAARSHALESCNESRFTAAKSHALENCNENRITEARSSSGNKVEILQLGGLKSLKKSKSPIKVSTSLKLPGFLMNRTPKEEFLFEPSKTHFEVVTEECEGGITIVESSDEEGGGVEKEEAEFENNGDDSVIVLSDSE